MPQRVKCLLTVLLATVLLAGCGGQDTPVEQAEEEAGVEEVIEEEAAEEPAALQSSFDCEQAIADMPSGAMARERYEKGSEKERTHMCLQLESQATGSPMPGPGAVEMEPEEQRDTIAVAKILNCQLNEASGGNESQADVVFNEAFAEAQQRGTGTTIQDVLSERGHDCGWVEYQESKGQ